MDEASEEGGFADAGGTEDDDFSFEGLRGRWRHFVVVVVFCGVVVLWCCGPVLYHDAGGVVVVVAKAKEKERKERKRKGKKRKEETVKDSGD